MDSRLWSTVGTIVTASVVNQDHYWYRSDDRATGVMTDMWLQKHANLLDRYCQKEPSNSAFKIRLQTPKEQNLLSHGTPETSTTSYAVSYEYARENSDRGPKLSVQRGNQLL